MTRARDRIRKAVESRGYAVESLDWEPIYNAGEMMGYGGGWVLVVDRPYVANTFPGDELGGQSTDELLADIDWSLKPSEPCDCDPVRPGRHPALGIVGDPDDGLHRPGCRWHLAYHLRWWRTSSDLTTTEPTETEERHG